MGLFLNVAKTKLIVDGETVEKVTKFNFLGALITQKSSCKEEIKTRLAMARSTIVKLLRILADRGITKTTKMRIV